jgi:hypothetical protein
MGCTRYRRNAVIMAPLFRLISLIYFASAASALSAQVLQPMDSPLPELRSWTLSARDLNVESKLPAQYQLQLHMAMVSGSRWSADVILDAAKRAAAILAQCGIRIDRVQLREFDAPPRYRYFSSSTGREFARRARLSKPTVFFVDDTLQRPAFDAEAIGRANSTTRPEIADTLWITAGIRDLPIALAHELVHVIADSGQHSDVPGNLMREDTGPENTQLTAAQCNNVVTTGRANGLLERLPAEAGK